MKSRETLIRLKKFQVDEKRRKVAQIEAMIAEFDRIAAELDREIKTEQERAGIHDPAHFAYPTYAKAAIGRRENLHQSAGELKAQLDDAKAALGEAFEELKKVEMLDERDHARVLLGLFARMVPLVEHLDFFELLERLAQRSLSVVHLDFEFIGRALEILAPAHRGLGIGRIGEMGGIVDSGAVLLELDLAVEFGRDTVEFGDHRLDLGNLAPLLVDLKFFQADKDFT